MDKPKKIFVKPRIPGQVIRDPRSHEVLPDDGASRPNNNFWNRRIIQGDVVKTTQPGLAETATPKSGQGQKGGNR